MKISSHLILPIVAAVLFLGGAPEWVSIETEQVDSPYGNSAVSLTNHSPGIVWVRGYFPWRLISGYQNKVGDSWTTQFGKGCGNGLGWRPIFPMQTIRLIVLLPDGLSRVVMDVRTTAGRSHIARGPDAHIGI